MTTTTTDIHPSARMGRSDISVAHAIPGATSTISDMENSNNDAPTGFLAGLAGRTRAEVCAAVHAAGGAYGKWLGTTTDPTSTITC